MFCESVAIYTKTLLLPFYRDKCLVCFQADGNSWREKGLCGIDNVLQPTDIGKWVAASYDSSLVTGNNLREDMFELQNKNISYYVAFWFVSQIQSYIGDDHIIIFFKR